MSTTTDPRESATATVEAPAPPVVRVSVPKRSFASELRAIKIVWRREVIRYGSDRLRIVTTLVQPLLFLFVLGSGLQQLSSAGTHGINLKTFIFPGILAISVLFTAMFSAASIVWDREFGFLREMMVAPIRRSSIVIGKVFGGASVACLQGIVIIAIAPRVKQMQSFMGVMQMIVTPMFFISGALFPVAGLATWLAILNRLDPLTYAVDPMRRAAFSHPPPSPAAQHALNSGVTWFGWRVPTLLEAAVIVILGLGMLGIAIWEFSSTEGSQ